MGRLLLYLIVFAAVGYTLYKYVYLPRAAAPTSPSHSVVVEPSAPKQTIDNARQTAREIERDSQRRVDELYEKTK